MMPSKNVNTACYVDQKSSGLGFSGESQDVRRVHSARLHRKLRRMKRRLLLDAMANDPMNTGYSNNGSSCSTMDSNSSLRLDDEDNLFGSSDDGEASFARARRVPYHLMGGSTSLTLDSSSSLLSDLSTSDIKEVQEALAQRRDDLGY